MSFWRKETVAALLQGMPMSCQIAAKKTNGNFYCTRDENHDGPCAAVPMGGLVKSEYDYLVGAGWVPKLTKWQRVKMAISLKPRSIETVVAAFLGLLIGVAIALLISLGAIMALAYGLLRHR